MYITNHKHQYTPNVYFILNEHSPLLLWLWETLMPLKNLNNCDNYHVILSFDNHKFIATVTCCYIIGEDSTRYRINYMTFSFIKQEIQLAGTNQPNQFHKTQTGHANLKATLLLMLLFSVSLSHSFHFLPEWTCWKLCDDDQVDDLNYQLN